MAGAPHRLPCERALRPARGGEWTGRWTEPDGVVQVRGTYLAQWRKVNGTWLIQAEVFVPTACTGSTYCAAHP